VSLVRFYGISQLLPTARDTNSYRRPSVRCIEITPSTREAIEAWIKRAGLKSESFLFPRRVHASPHFSTRQYAVVVQLEVNSALEREKNFTLRSK
jgi:hypothetical protein